MTISCAHHDYIEIACTYRLSVRITLYSGVLLTGKAFDTTRNSTGEECLVIEHEGQRQSIVLTEIAQLRAITANPHFDTVDFPKPNTQTDK